MAGRPLLPFLPSKNKLIELLFGPIFKILRKHYISPWIIFLIIEYYVFYLFIKVVLKRKYFSKVETITYAIGLSIAVIGITVGFIVEQIHLIKLFLQTYK